MLRGVVTKATAERVTPTWRSPPPLAGVRLVARAAQSCFANSCRLPWRRTQAWVWSLSLSLDQANAYPLVSRRASVPPTHWALAEATPFAGAGCEQLALSEATAGVHAGGPLASVALTLPLRDAMATLQACEAQGDRPLLSVGLRE